jgi:hypothetical protein
LVVAEQSGSTEHDRHVPASHQLDGHWPLEEHEMHVPPTHRLVEHWLFIVHPPPGGSPNSIMTSFWALTKETANSTESRKTARAIERLVLISPLLGTPLRLIMIS